MPEYRNGKGGGRPGAPRGGKEYGPKGYVPRGERGGFGAKRSYEERTYAAKKPYGKPGPKADRPMRGPKSAPAPRAPRPRPSYAPSYGEEANLENILAGRNPIREAIINGRHIEKLLVARGLTGSALEIIARARAAGIVVQEVDRVRLDAIYSNHQGMLAYASAAEYVSLQELMEIPAERGEEPFFVILDGVTDPHNLGAILRSAACAGAHGVIVPERRAAGLVPAAVKAAAGALEHIAVAKVGNLRQTVDTLKEAGIWLTAADAEGECVYDADLSGPVCLVIGSEGDGVSPLVLSHCDRTVSLPMSNGMESLNASVAAGILLYEIRKTRAGR
ncbi:MAG: 23S rRNA (guanosine(2251)-2'-O)-methyltransferase RlmB [Eubacteriales bacterium]|nr:23S rRNA (guanosine(2251)-2'-O)-methyltransferase RlmB [Eubacteriales bacterium]